MHRGVLSRERGESVTAIARYLGIGRSTLYRALDLGHDSSASHATELINGGVSIEVVRRRLGHASTETTQVYALLADQVADTEIRAARRKRETRRR